MSNYNVNIQVRVHDTAALYRAAVESYLAESTGNPCHLFGPACDPEIEACLVQLLDPSALPGSGVEIIESSAEKLWGRSANLDA